MSNGCLPTVTIECHAGNGNSSFRNEMFNGRPITLSPAFIHPLPTAGILSFDFSSSTKPAPEGESCATHPHCIFNSMKKSIKLAPHADMVATDARVVKGLMSCFLLPQTQIHDALLKLKRYQVCNLRTARAHMLCSSSPIRMPTRGWRRPR